MTRARNSANLASQGNLFVDIANDRTGIGSVVPAQNLHVAGTAGFHADVTFTGDLYNTTWDRSANSLKFVDNATAKFGDSGDLSIFHNGNSYIKSKTNDLVIYTENAGDIYFKVNNSETAIRATANGSVRLSHDNSTKFSTEAYGTNTTGTAVNDGLVVAGVATVTTMNVTGVLTYDDVTSVDSVGIVTARQGVHVTGGSVLIGSTTNTGHTGADDLLVANDSGHAGLTIRSNSSNHAQVSFADGTSGNDQYMGQIIYDHPNNVMIFRANGPVERFHIDSNGVQVTGALDVTDNVVLADSVRHRGDMNTRIRFPDNQLITAEIDGTESLRINSDGNVIIGTSSWSFEKALNVQGTSGSIISLYNGDTTTYAANTFSGIELKLNTGNTGNTNGACEIRAFKENGTNGNNARALSFYTGVNGGSPTERLRIDSTGRVLVNTTTTNNGNNKMIIEGPSPSGTYAPYDGQLVLKNSETSGAINTGSALVFFGHDGGNQRGSGAIRCLKENGTSGNHNFYMSFLTRVDGGSNTEKMRITSAGDLGLGINSPARHFHLHVDSSAANYQSFTNSTTGTTSSDGFLLGISSSEQGIIWNYENSSIRIATNNAERLTITGGGAVGINQTAPEAQLHVENNNAHSSTYYLNTDAAILVDNKNNSGKAVIKLEHDAALVYGSGSASFIISDRENERLRIDSGGNLGLGINSPVARLHVHNSGTGEGDHAYAYFTTGDTGSDASSGLTVGVAANQVASVNYREAGALSLGTSSTERLRITSSGTVGINDSSPNTYFKLDVNGHTNIVGDIALPTTNRIYFGTSDTAFIKGEHGSSAYLAFGANNEQMRLTRSGRLGIGTDNPSTYKLHVQESTSAIARFERTGGAFAKVDIKAGTTAGNSYLTFSDSAASEVGEINYEHADDSLRIAVNSAERLRIDSDGKLTLTSNDGMFIRPATDSQDAKITFSTNNNNNNSQVGHFKYNHQDDNVVSGYGEGFILGGTESNGCVLRVDGGINLIDSGSAGGNGAKLSLGGGQDMRIYHTGSDGFIDGTGTGGFRLRYNDIIISNYNSSGTRRFKVNKDQGMDVFATTNGGLNGTDGVTIRMSDHSSEQQIGSISYKHSDNSYVNDGTNECFKIHGTEAQTALLLDGRMYISDSKFVLKPTFSNFDDIPNGTNSGNSVGCMMKYNNEANGNSGVMSNSAKEPFIANRSGDDGTVIRIRHQGNTEGEIKVNGSSVSYNNFMGAHKAQFVDHSKPDILIGTVLETVDQLATWKYASFSVGVGTAATTKYIPYYGSKNDGETDTITFESNTYNAAIKNYRDPMPEITKHVCVKVSDTVGSKAVFGVFNCWEEEDVVERESGNAEYSWNDLDVAAIGNYFIRMQSGQTPEVGDYVESAGDGTAKVQSDDILRSKTIAKITSTTKQKTYDDGSFIVTCTMHCG